MPQPIILLVEDDPLQVNMVMRALQKLAVVHHAATGAEAIRLSRSLQPALILMDLALPEISGIDAGEAIRQHAATAHIPLVAVTANTIDETEYNRVRQYFDTYIEKPFHMDDLRHLIEQLLP